MLKILFRFLVCVTCASCINLKEPKIFSLWHDFPLTTMMNETLLQPQCRKAYQNFLELVENNDLNALKMLDATGKLPSGILSGNVNQYGDFSECMEVKEAQYCLVELDLEPLWQKSYSQYKNLVHSYYFLKDTFEDPAHRIPGFNIVRWGFCLPRECSAEDLQRSLEKNIGVLTQIRPGMCQKSETSEKPLSFGDYIARIFFTTIIAAVIASSLIDYVSLHLPDKDGIFRNLRIARNGLPLRVLMGFSLRKNVSQFLEVKNTKNEIHGLHGIRSLNVFALLMCHKSVSLFFNPYTNRTQTINRLSQPWSIIGKNAIAYTDTFILLSGLLNANALLTDLNNGQSMKFKDKLVNRIFRILPNIVALILFCTYILPHMGSGPLWPTVVDHHSELCKQYMWRNIFFIHNYFGFENMCLTHTHQVGIDMQLFLITPIVIYLIWMSKRIGLSVLVFLSLVSTVLRFWISYEHELTSVIYFGIPISKMFLVANLSYILPTHRATVYLIGVYMAYFLKFSKSDTSFSKIQMTTIWCFFLTCFLGSWLGGYHMVLQSYVYKRLEASIIAALYPILWGISVSFGIYAVNKNIAGWFGDFLCWKYFQIGTRIAYAVYLVQFPVFFYNVGLTKHSDEYKMHYLLQILETMAILICSLLLIFLIEMPFQNIKRAIFDYEKEQKRKILDDNDILQTRKSKSG